MIYPLLYAQKASEKEGGGEKHGQMLAAQERSQAVRTNIKNLLAAEQPRVRTNDSDYVFITFVVNHLPHGFIGLLVAAFFAAALASKAAELNALASTTTIDFYRHM